MSHLSIRINQEDENHLRFLEQTLGLDRSEATRVALSMAAEAIKQKETCKLKFINESEFVGGNESDTVARIGYRQKLRDKLEAKYGIQQKKKHHH